jgi:hypothetical protein
MATRRIVLDDGTERIYKDADVYEDRGTLVVKQDVASLGENDPFPDLNVSYVADILAQYPPGTWKYWETVEDFQTGD